MDKLFLDYPDGFILDIKGNLVDFTDLYIVNIKDVDLGYNLSKDRVSLKEGAIEHLFNTYLYCYTLLGDNRCSLVVMTDDEDTAWRLSVMLKQDGYQYNDMFICVK